MIKEQLEKYLTKRINRVKEMGVENPNLILNKQNKLEQYTKDSVTISVGGETKDGG